MRYNDVRHGTAIVEGALEKYKAAWEKKQMIGANGLYPDFWLVRQDITIPAKDVGFTAW